MLPAQRVQFAGVGEFTHGAVGFAAVESELSAISHGVRNQFGKAADGDFLARTDVDVSVTDILLSGFAGIFKVHVLHDEYAGVRHFLTPEEFTQRRSRTP